MSTSSRPRGVLRALAHRNFQLFFGGQLISLIGTWMQTVAQSWLVYRLTGSTVLLGAVAFSSQIPVFLLAPIGGTVADRHNRHRIVIATQISAMLLALVLALLTLTGRIQVWQVALLGALLGVVNAFDIPARQSFLVEMVGREDLMNAIALNSSMFNGARVMGPAIAGLLMMRLGKPRQPDRTVSPLESVLEGFRYARVTGPIRALLLLVGLVSLVGMPYSVLMPVFADAILHGGARGLGTLMGATGVGALLGALTLANRTGLRGLGTWTASAAAGFGISLILFACSRWFYLSAFLLVLTGFGMMLQMACTNTLLQSMTPDRLRGRVIALYSMMFMGMAPFGALFAGVAAGRLGAPLTVGAGGAICLLGAALFATRLPRLRGEARELILAQHMIAGEPPEEMGPRAPARQLSGGA